MITELTEQGLPEESIARLLVKELRAAPQLRELVLRELLTEDFLALPQRMDRLETAVGEFRAEVNARMDGMQGDVNLLKGQMGDLQGDVNLLKGQMGDVQNQVGDLNGQVGNLQGRVGNLQGWFGNLRGESYEDKCRESIDLVLVDYVDRPALADRAPIHDALIEARRSGTISRVQYDRVRVVDIIATGAEVSSNRPILAIVEASVTINEYDVNAAYERAAILQNITGQETRPFCVANVQWSDALAGTARGLGVTLIHYELPHFDDSDQ